MEVNIEIIILETFLPLETNWKKYSSSVLIKYLSRYNIAQPDVSPATIDIVNGVSIIVIKF